MPEGRRVLTEFTSDIKAVIAQVRSIYLKNPDKKIREAAKNATDAELARVALLLEPGQMAKRLSAGAWEPAAHLMHLSRAIYNAVRTQGGGRLMVSMPRRCGKSELCTHWSPAWFLSTWPTHRVILASYEADFAEQWGGRVRDTLTRYAPILGVTLKEDSKARGRWDTSQGGGMVAAGAGGALMGRGAHLFIVDDPFKTWEEAQSETIREKVWEWFQTSVLAGLEPHGTIVVVHTRWHPEDLIGKLLAQDTRNRWKYIKLSAKATHGDALGRPLGAPLWPERWPLEVLDELERTLDPRMWAGLYQQEPSVIEGDLIKRSWWRYYDPAALPPLTAASGVEWERLIQSWDTSFSGAASSDFVVGQVWGLWRGNLYLVDQVRRRMDFPATCDAIRAMTQKWPKTRLKLIEQSANGWAIIQTLQHEIQGIQAVSTKGRSKLARLVGESDERAHAVSVLIRDGKCWLPDPQADRQGADLPSQKWVKDFVDECAAFTGVGDGHDDQVDAMTQALSFMQPSAWRPVAQAKQPTTTLEMRQREHQEYIKGLLAGKEQRGEATERFSYLNGWQG